MTLQEAREDLAACRLHPLTDTNIERIENTGSELVFHTFDPDADRLDELRSERDDLNKENAQITKECDELGQRVNELETALEEAKDAQLLATYNEDAERFRKAASEWAVEVQAARRSLEMLRKRKGLEAGFVAEAQTIMAYLHDNPDPAAQAIVTKMHSYK